MIKDILAIDMHTHLNHGSKLDWNTELEYYNGTLEYLDAMNKACNVEKMFASTFSSVISTEEVEKENEYMFEFLNRLALNGLCLGRIHMLVVFSVGVLNML